MTTDAIDQSLDLIYSDLQEPGFGRRKRGRGFSFLDATGNRLTDAEALAYCRSLVIPPAWQDIWICQKINGHIICTGSDDRGRKQYLYHALWSEWRNRQKFDDLADFARRLGRIRQRVQDDLDNSDDDRQRTTAAAVRLIDKGLIRVGNEAYARENKTFGATTLQARHVTIDRDAIVLDFVGKSHKQRHVELSDPSLAAALCDSEGLPGQRLFQFRDAAGEVQAVTSSHVNAYLQAASGLDDVSAKRFRTWGGTVAAWQYAHAHRDDAVGKPSVPALKHVAAVLGNTVSVARRYYVHPALVEAIDDGTFPRRSRHRRKGMDSSESTVAQFLDAL